MSVLQQQEHNNNNTFKHVTHTFLSGKLSSTLIIPIRIARKYGLDKPSNVIIEEHHNPDGILVRKLEI